MKKLMGIVIAVMFLMVPVSLMAAGDVAKEKAEAEIAIKAADAAPTDYAKQWQAAKAIRLWIEDAMKTKAANWKNDCKVFGKKGMGYGEKAQKLNPNGVEGFYYYGLNVGSYSDGVSIVTALSEGLKGKTQSGFEKAYALNKMFDDGGPMVGLGRFWMVLPWPMKDNKLAKKYLSEYNQLFPAKPQGQLYLGEILLKDDKAKGKALLEAASKSDDKYYADQAKALLK